MNTLKSVRVGHQFYIKERNAYSNPFEAFVREFIQNSFDAKASNINLFWDGSTYSVLDNGIGMDIDTLNNVFLVLGETTKSGSGSIGGFGRARMLQLFAHPEWSIQSQNWTIKGFGGDYLEPELNDDYFRGCHFQVKMDLTPKHSYNSEPDMKYVTESYLKKCEIIFPNVYFNGELFTDYLIKTEQIKELFINGKLFATVYKTNKKQNRCYVRINGIAMFDDYIDPNESLVFEINPELSRDALTSNRDSFNTDYREVYNAFIEEVTKDYKAILDANKKSFRKIYGSPMEKRKSTVTSKNKQSAKAKIAYTSAMKGSTTGKVRSGTVDNLINADLNVVSVSNDIMDIAYTAQDSHYDELVKCALIDIPATEDNKYFKAAMSWDLDKLDKNSDRFMLLKLWCVLIDSVLDLVCEKYDVSISYGVGLTFDTECEANHHKEDSIHYFAFNPIDKNTYKIKYSLKNSVGDLLALAVHEVTHYFQSYHDEWFACRMTDIDKLVYAEVMKKSNLFNTRIKEFVTRSRSKVA